MLPENQIQDARIEWVLNEIKSLGLKYPVKEVSAKTGYAKGIVSNYLSKKAVMSLAFIEKFCETFSYDFGKVNHSIINSIKSDLSNDNNQSRNNSTNTLQYGNSILNSQPPINQGEQETMIYKLNERLVEHLMEVNRQLLQTNYELAKKVPDAKKQIPV